MYILLLSILPFLAVALFAVFTVWLFVSARSARKSGAPYFPTPTRAIRAALRAAELRPGESFYDLGAGTGRALLIAEHEFGARATGFEISPLFAAIALADLFLHRSRATIKMADFFKEDIGGADVIFCFLAIRTMARMEEQIGRQAKAGARIIVYAFPLPGMKPTQVIPVRGQWKMYLYRLA
ncbi:MAG TPA: class I SAM-dependent methyltransferase [Candidatus Paceibacterota bacterium]|nr:class I SAM-dependent methyltransferase [Candidatus Paceibacterota bacterium]